MTVLFTSFFLSAPPMWLLKSPRLDEEALKNQNKNLSLLFYSFTYVHYAYLSLAQGHNNRPLSGDRIY